MKWQERNYFTSMAGVAVGLGGAVHFLLAPWSLSDLDQQRFYYAKAPCKKSLYCSISSSPLQLGSRGQICKQST